MRIPQDRRGPPMLQLRLTFASLPLALVLAACTRAPQAGGEGAQVTPEGRRRVDERAIEQSGARTAWDALQRTVPFFVFRTNSRGRPTRVEHRGRSSIVLHDQPLILVDGVALRMSPRWATCRRPICSTSRC